MSTHPKVLLIGGTSHVGKSTLARQIADALGWRLLSTDQLARHPGRPWRDDATIVPEDVVAHYAEGSPTGLLDEMLDHYRRNVWPIIDAVTRSHVGNRYDPCLVFEGSAILPELVAAARFENVTAVWLRAPVELIRTRILDGSRHADRSAAERGLIEAFLERTLAFEDMLEQSAAQHGQLRLDATSEDTRSVLIRACRN